MYERLSGTWVGRLLGFGSGKAMRAWDVETGIEGTIIGSGAEIRSNMELPYSLYPVRRNNPRQPSPRQEGNTVIFNTQINIVVL